MLVGRVKFGLYYTKHKICKGSGQSLSHWVMTLVLMLAKEWDKRWWRSINSLSAGRDGVTMDSNVGAMSSIVRNRMHVCIEDERNGQLFCTASWWYVRFINYLAIQKSSCPQKSLPACRDADFVLSSKLFSRVTRLWKTPLQVKILEQLDWQPCWPG